MTAVGGCIGQQGVPRGTQDAFQRKRVTTCQWRLPLVIRLGEMVGGDSVLVVNIWVINSSWGTASSGFKGAHDPLLDDK